MLDRYAERLVPFAPTMLRVMVGLTFLLNGYPKISRIAGYTAFVRSLGMPAPEVLAWIPAIVETVGGLLLIVGLGVRWLSLYFTAEMIVTTVLAKLAHGMPYIRFQEWLPNQQPGLGYEMDVILLGASAVLVVLGAGQLSIDRNLLKHERALLLESPAPTDASRSNAGALPV